MIDFIPEFNRNAAGYTDLPSSIFQDPSLDERGRSEISHDASLGILSACLACIDLPRDFGAGESGDNYGNLCQLEVAISMIVENEIEKLSWDTLYRNWISKFPFFDL